MLGMFNPCWNAGIDLTKVKCTGIHLPLGDLSSCRCPTIAQKNRLRLMAKPIFWYFLAAFLQDAASSYVPIGVVRLAELAFHDTFIRCGVDEYTIA
jgi:hypothetical protein